MSIRLRLHPENPQPRILSSVVTELQQGSVCVLPTDSGYSFACGLDQKTAMNRIAQIRSLDKEHLFTLLCHDLSAIANCAFVSNPSFRLLKSHTPGPFTFILKASKAVPRRLWQTKRKTIGIRVPDSNACQAILQAYAEPIMVVSLNLPELDELYYYDIDWLVGQLKHQVDVIVDVGNLPLTPTTVIDLTEDEPRVLRQGAGVLL